MNKRLAGKAYQFGSALSLSLSRFPCHTHTCIQTKTHTHPHSVTYFFVSLSKPDNIARQGAKQISPWMHLVGPGETQRDSHKHTRTHTPALLLEQLLDKVNMTNDSVCQQICINGGRHTAALPDNSLIKRGMMEKHGHSNVANLLLTRKPVASAQTNCLRIWPYVCLMVSFLSTRAHVHLNVDQEDGDTAVLLGMIAAGAQYGLVWLKAGESKVFSCHSKQVL